MQDGATVLLSIPADTRFVALTRAAAAGLAAEFDFTMDELEDLRVGVDEVVTVLIEAAAAQPVELTYRIIAPAADDDGGSTGIEIAGRCEGASDLALDELTRRILAAVVDDVTVGADGIAIVKYRSDA